MARQNLAAASTPAIPCPICAAESRFWFLWDGYPVHRCASCGTEVTHPSPPRAELEAFYQDYNRAMMVAWERKLARVRRAVRGYIRAFQRVTGRRPETALDLGGGAGHYARAFTDEGVRCTLVDYGSEALDFARRVHGLTAVIRGDITRCDELCPAASFDLVLARHAIEHVPEPAAMLRAISTVLRPGGLLEIETPDVTSREQLAHPAVIAINAGILHRSNPGVSVLRALAIALRKSVSGVNPPKHLWGFTPRGLGMLLARSGLRVREQHRAIAGHPVFDPLYWELHGPASRRAIGLPYYLFERACCLLFAGRGMNLAVLARREGQDADATDHSASMVRRAVVLQR